MYNIGTKADYCGYADTYGFQGNNRENGLLHVSFVLMSVFAVNPLPNAALGKPTWQTSIKYDGVPERAVDGNRNTDYNQNSCTHTAEEYPEPAVWGVDLKSAMPVFRVDVITTEENSRTKYIKGHM